MARLDFDKARRSAAARNGERMEPIDREPRKRHRPNKPVSFDPTWKERYRELDPFSDSYKGYRRKST